LADGSAPSPHILVAGSERSRSRNTRQTSNGREAEKSMMSPRYFARALVALSLTVTAASGAFAQAAAEQPAAENPTAEKPKEFAPTVGQEGKDVIWVPTAQALVDRMLDMAKVTPSDTVIDLGSGDGRTVITAAKRGAKALGIEYNPNMVELSRRNAAQEGVADKATFTKADLFETDLSGATVITMFLLPEINLKLRPKILDLRPGTRVVSNSFNMGDWEADQTAEARDGCTSYCKAFFWVVPAKVDGTWRTPAGDLVLEQKYQTFSGTLKSKGGTTKVTGGKLVGDEITFTAGGTQYTGRVKGSTIEGTSRSGGKEAKWQATAAR
jgi:SAM-dependent methyltransferase